MVERQVDGWVWDTNVRALLEWLSGFIGYGYDHLDEQAVEAGVEGSDAEEPNGRFQYPLGGRPPLLVELARNTGGSEVEVRVTGEMDDVLVARVETLVGLLAETHDYLRTGPKP